MVNVSQRIYTVGCGVTFYVDNGKMFLKRKKRERDQQDSGWLMQKLVRSKACVW